MSGFDPSNATQVPSQTRNRRPLTWSRLDYQGLRSPATGLRVPARVPASARACKAAVETTRGLAIRSAAAMVSVVVPEVMLLH